MIPRLIVFLVLLLLGLGTTAAKDVNLENFYSVLSHGLKTRNDLRLPFKSNVNKIVMNRIEPTAKDVLKPKQMLQGRHTTEEIIFGEVGLFNTSSCDHSEGAFLSLRTNFCYQSLDENSDPISFLIYETQLFSYVFVSIEIYEDSDDCEGDFFTDIVDFLANGQCTDFSADGYDFYATYNTLVKPPPPLPNYPSFITLNTYDDVSSCVNEIDGDTFMIAQSFATPFQAFCYGGFAINCTTLDDLEFLEYEEENCTGEILNRTIVLPTDTCEEYKTFDWAYVKIFGYAAVHCLTYNEDHVSSRAPTPVPTPRPSQPVLPPSQEVITVRYNVSQAIENVSDTAYYADIQDSDKTLQETIATVTGLNDYTLIRILDVEPLLETTMLRDSARRAQSAVNYNNLFLYEVSFTLGQGNTFTSAEQGYNETTKNLQTSIGIGLFTNTLRTNSKTYDGLAFVEAIAADEAKFTSFTTTTTPADTGDSGGGGDDGISEGATAAAVLFPLFIVFGGGGYYYYHYHYNKGPSSSSSSSDSRVKTNVYGTSSSTLKKDLLTLDEKQMSSSI